MEPSPANPRLRLFLIGAVDESALAEALNDEYGDSEHQFFVAAATPEEAAYAYLRYCTMGTDIEYPLATDNAEGWRQWVDDNLIIWSIPESLKAPGVLSWRHFANQAVFSQPCDKVRLSDAPIE